MDAGRELDVLVATKFMSWRRMTEREACRLRGIELPTTFPDERTQQYADGLTLYWHTPDGGIAAYAEPWGDDPAWAPSTDIAAAWQVIEHHPHYVYLQRSNDNGRFGWKDHMTWRCRFYAPQSFEVEADTAPLAICRAALQCMEE